MFSKAPTLCTDAEKDDTSQKFIHNAPPAQNFDLVIVSGLSGAGKSTALKVFEDLRYCTMDGLPIRLIPEIMKISDRTMLSSCRGLVLGMDLRQKVFVHDFEKAMDHLNSLGITPITIFIEADTSALLQRYATTRRPHPLESEGYGLENALAEEKIRLAAVRDVADRIIDTTNYSIHDLRRVIQQNWSSVAGRIRGLRVNVVSFGFKYGVPKEADVVFDVRFLPNPYFDEALRPLSGLDTAIASYVFGNESACTFRHNLLNFITETLPLYELEGRYRLTIAIGCTGGRHRSVATADALATALKNADYAVTVEHRHFELG